MRVYLLVTSRNEVSELKSIDVSMHRANIGRQAGGIAVSDPFASSEHASLSLGDGGTIHIEDLKSRNGTYVNGRKVKSAVLHVGDVIRIGRTVLKVVKVKNSQTQTATERQPEAIHTGASLYFECLPEHLKKSFDGYVE